MRLQAAIILGKLISFLTRTFKIGGGSAAPGLYALKVDSNLVEKLGQKIPKNVVITGTNGKTTTARILNCLAKEAGLKVIRNQTGSNLERGIASALISNLHPGGGGSNYDLGVWELDEFAFNKIVPKLKPNLVLFLNVSRDQLDRYGEVDQVINRWCETISKLDPKTIILIDPSLSKLKKYFKVKEFTRPKNIKTKGLSGSSFQLSINRQLLTINLPIPGIYNIENAVAAINAASYLNLPIHQLTNSLTNFQPAFGRFEKISFGYVFPKEKGKLLPEARAGAYIFLIKNPAGATSVFKTIVPQIKSTDRLLLALNDKLADGTDVSWIWDANFETLLSLITYHLSLICSGTRAADLAVRLKYAGFNPNSITVEPNLQNALELSRKGLKGNLFILPTYTALLHLQSILTQQGVKSHYWKEQ